MVPAETRLTLAESEPANETTEVPCWSSVSEQEVSQVAATCRVSVHVYPLAWRAVESSMMRANASPYSASPQPAGKARLTV